MVEIDYLKSNEVARATLLDQHKNDENKNDLMLNLKSMKLNGF